VLSLPLAAAVVTVVGAVAATAAHDGRVAVLGLLLAAVASTVVASPLPGSLAVTARILGALLACYLLWTAARMRSAAAGSPIGPAAETAAAAAAFVAGLAIRPVDPLLGPVEAQAAGLSLIVLAVAPLAGRDVLRMGIGVLLLTLGGALEMSAWGGTTCSSTISNGACAIPDLEQLAVAALLAGTAGAVCLLAPSDEAAGGAEEARGPVLDLWAPEPALQPGAPISSRAAPSRLSRRPVPAESASLARSRHQAPVAAPKVAAPETPASPKGAAPSTPGGTVVPAPTEPAAPAAPTSAPRSPAEAAASDKEAGRMPGKTAQEPGRTAQAAGEGEARPGPRPMTADPLEFDDWLAWSAPEPEPRPKRRQWRGRKPGPSEPDKDEKP
jgi:hypothetical protein